MLQGYRIVYHKSIQLTDEIKAFLEAKSRCMLNGYGNGGWRSYYKRGIFGDRINTTNYTFKRLSTKRRIFGAIPIDLLVGKNEPINLNQCICPTCLGGTPVTIKGGFEPDDYITYFETGQIKG